MKFIVMILIAFLFFSCAGDELSDPTPKDRLIYPVKMVLSKDESKLFVANTNFDLRYRGASVVVIDIKTQKILSDETKLTDSFLSDIKIDYDNNILFTVSKNTPKLYAYKVSDTSPYLSCDEDEKGNCSDDYSVELSIDTPAVIAIDKSRKLVYIGHKSGSKISVVSYFVDDKLKLKLLKTFDVENLNGNITSVVYDENSDKVYVSSDYTKYLVSFKPLMDYYGNISKIFYYPLTKVTNRALLLNSNTHIEDICLYKDKLFLSMSNPSSVSVLVKEKLNGEEEGFVFDKSVYMDYFPVKTVCFDEGLCISSIYENKSLAFWDADKSILISNLVINKRAYDMIYSKVNKELYITLFIDNAIMILDMDENSPSFLKIKKLMY